ncbi:MAG: tRNA epoxyqueuosine(34) reductase QueG [Candidatus Zixiibacteriota bacterium]|nr:MAG: tRNA epoxyqueuosine(34) reductase QueG [candidate division Zixibacteria bacterium]
MRASTVKEYARSLGASAVGIAPAGPVEKRQQYLDWLARGYAGEMTYLKRYRNERLNPEELFPGARSIIVVGLNYYPAANRQRQSDVQHRVALYARGEDYHRVLRRMLKRLRTRLHREHPDLRGRICVDTAPFMDKYWAGMAGIGWQGKHTNLVSREFGSWLVIGSLVINGEMDCHDRPHLDRCGNCRRCLEACPTRAFPEPYQLDATRCISYWTIESKQDKIPADIAAGMDNEVFGCDRCISVCPFNRFSKPERTQALKRTCQSELIESGEVLRLTEEQFDLEFAGSAIRRAGLRGIKRNIDAIRHKIPPG